MKKPKCVTINHRRPQSKRPQCRTAVPAPDSGLDQEGLPPFNPEVDYPSCLCIFDRIAGEPVRQVPLTTEEYFSVLQVPPHGIHAEEFMAEAIREKLAAQPGRMARPTVSDDQLAAMFGLIDGLQPEVHKYRVLTLALIDCLQRWGINAGCPSREEASRTVAGFNAIGRELEEVAQSKYSAVLAQWCAISPGLSRGPAAARRPAAPILPGQLANGRPA